MNRILIPFSILLFTLTSYGQKPSISFTELDKKWPAAPYPIISNNGKFITLNYQDVDGVNIVEVYSLQSKWRFKVRDVQVCKFSQNSQNFLFLRHDSLYIGTVGRNRVSLMSTAVDFNLINKGDDQDWLIYHQKDKDIVVIRALQTKKRFFFDGIKQWWNLNNTKMLLVKQDSSFTESQKLILLDMQNGLKKTIWSGNNLAGLKIDDSGSAIAFLVKNGGASELWYADSLNWKANKFIIDKMPGIDGKIQVNGIRAVSRIDQRVFFTYFKLSERSKTPSKALVNIWSYKDAKLQSKQEAELNNPIEALAVIQVVNKNIINVGNAKSALYSLTGRQDYILVIDPPLSGDPNEWNWNVASKHSLQLLSLSNGTKQIIDTTVQTASVGGTIMSNNSFLSPSVKYVVYFDAASKNWFSYDIRGHHKQNLTAGLKTIWTSYDRNDEYASPYYLEGVAGFMKNDTDVLIYDQYDIFQIDLSGKRPPLNLTNDYGKKHQIVFRIPTSSDYSNFESGKKLVITALNRINKDEGFFKITVGQQKDPVLLSMQSCHTENTIKSRDSDVYLLTKEKASEYPNWFTTKDFKTYEQLTLYYPEKAYNWLSSELVNFNTLDGKPTQGILYKPENFDPHKKYPVIFQYYEQKTQYLYRFQAPRFSNAEISIPYFVSNGYLVFTPDIHYLVGHPGESAYNAIIGAANVLVKNAWVDSTKLGLQGHSFGGFETLYTITHSDRFAAAMAGSPMTDFISAYGSIIGNGASRQRQYELYRDRIGGTLWDKQNFYIENSPVLRANEVSTPLLMMSNDKDHDVPFQQGVEMFTAMRRLGKKAWMMQYNGADHVLIDNNGKDYTIRIKQFFDYYLKGAPPPHWMTDGIPASMKGIDDGLTLDTSGKTP